MTGAEEQREEKVYDSLLAEVSVLGGILLANDIARSVIGMLVPEDFTLSGHVIVFSTMTAMLERGEAVDLLTIADRLKRDSNLAKIGGLEYLSYLVNAVPSAANSAWYARIVREYADKRTLRRLGEGLSADAAKGKDEAADLATTAIRSMREIAGRDKGHGVSLMKDIVEAEDFDKPLDFLTAGHELLDEKLCGGFVRGYCTIVAARTSNGKTSLATQMMLGMGAAGLRVGLVSCEMSTKPVAFNMISQHARIDNALIRNGTLFGPQQERYEKAKQEMAKMPIFIYDSPGMRATDAWSALERHIVSDKLDVIMLDYIQLLRGGKSGRREDVGLVSGALKSVAREHNIVAVGISQVARSQREHESKMPTLSMLKESGDIENDADVVIILHRPDIGAPEAEMELCIAKYRGGQTCKFKAAWTGKYTRIERLAWDSDTEREEQNGRRTERENQADWRDR